MTFISSLDPRRSLLQNGGSTYTGSSTPLSRTFDRFSSSRKSGVFERPSTYSPTPTTHSNSSGLDLLGSKYHSSTLERIKNGTDSTKSSLQTPTSPTSFLSNGSRLSTSSPVYHRLESTPTTSFGTQRFDPSVPNHQR